MRRGRPARILSSTIDQVERLLEEEPDITYAEVAVRLRLRRSTAKTLVLGLRHQERHTPPKPGEGPDTPEHGRDRSAAFPKSERAT